MYSQFVLPYERRVAEAIKAAGASSTPTPAAASATAWT